MAACSSGGSSESAGGSSGSSSASGGSSASSSSKSSGGSSGGSSSSSANGGSSSSSSSSKPDSTGGKGGGTGTGTGGKGGGGGSDQGGAGGKGGGTGTGTGTGGKGGNGTTGGAVGGSTGGAATGGAGGTGSTGTGDTGPTEPAVYTSTDGSCVSGSDVAWKPGTIATSTGTATVTIEGSNEKQTWEGFGGTFNEKGWDAMAGLGETEKARLIKLMFAKDGARFTIGRIPIGASDYGTDRYTCDEGGEDTAMANFKIDRDKKALIPYIKAALEVNPDLKFWASPWTPPTWMKVGPFTAVTDDSATTKSNFDSGNMSDKEDYLKAYAQYFVKWIDAFKGEGIKVSMVAPQNEPGYALHYPSCLWSSSVYAKFVGQHLGPALKDTGVDIMLGTLSNAEKDIDLANAALADATAKPFFKVVGVQWNVLEKLYTGTKIGNSPVWATEHKCGNYPWNPEGYPKYNSTQAPNDQAYGVESWGYIRDAINKAGVTAYNAWNMILDHVGNGIDSHRQWNQDSLLAVNMQSKTVKVTAAYCVFRHFSQFVDPGAKVLSSSGETVAFKNPDGSLVAVLYSAQAKDKFVVSMGGKKFEFNMPAGWATVKVPK